MLDLSFCPECEADLRERYMDANGQVAEGSMAVWVVEIDPDLDDHYECPECGHWFRPQGEERE